MRLVQWGMIGFILVAAYVAQLLGEQGSARWGLGYWLIVGGALWGVSAGNRGRRRMASRIKAAIDNNLPAEETRRRLNARVLLSMASASSVAYWGLVVRFALHGTLWQALPFYLLGLILLLIWGPRASTPTQSN